MAYASRPWCIEALPSRAATWFCVLKAKFAAMCVHASQYKQVSLLPLIQDTMTLSWA